MKTAGVGGDNANRLKDEVENGGAKEQEHTAT